MTARDRSAWNDELDRAAALDAALDPARNPRMSELLGRDARPGAPVGRLTGRIGELATDCHDALVRAMECRADRP